MKLGPVELGLMSADDLENGIRASGDGVKVDFALKGGEVFDPGDGMELEIVVAPGHSAGKSVC